MQSRWILTVLLAVVSACEPDSNVSPAQTADAAAPDAAGPADAADARPAPVPPDAAAALPPDAADLPPQSRDTCGDAAEKENQRVLNYLRLAGQASPLSMRSTLGLLIRRM